MRTLYAYECPYVYGGIDPGSASKLSAVISTGIFRILWETSKHSLQGSIFGVVLSGVVGVSFESFGSWGANYINSIYATPNNSSAH